MSEICLVTGCAGFVGSHLAERLLADGHTVVGVDGFTDHYSRVLKEANLASLRGKRGFEFIDGDLTRLEPVSLMDGVTVVFHLAAHETGRISWGRDFAAHTRNTILATQLMLEASLHVSRFIYTSSAQVYGEATAPTTDEDTLPRPLSPYGAAKLAGEALCNAYAMTSSVPTIALRLFSVYGPRQRPDQFFHRLLRNITDENPIDVFGDGEQVRDFVHVRDVVEACVAAMRTRGRGEVVNVGSGQGTTLDAAVDLLKSLTGCPDHEVKHHQKHRGDRRSSVASLDRAREILGFEPKVSLEEGLKEEVEWFKSTMVAPLET